MRRREHRVRTPGWLLLGIDIKDIHAGVLLHFWDPPVSNFLAYVVLWSQTF